MAPHDDLLLTLAPREPSPVLIEQLAGLARASRPGPWITRRRRVSTPVIAAILGSGLALTGTAYAERSHLAPLLDAVVHPHAPVVPPAPSRVSQVDPSQVPAPATIPSPTTEDPGASESDSPESPHTSVSPSEAPERSDAGSTSSQQTEATSTGQDGAETASSSPDAGGNDH